MSDPIESAAGPGVIARALWTLATLVTAGRVEHTTVWHSTRLLNEQVLRIDATGYPAELVDLLAAMPDATPEEWQGVSFNYREWRGHLLTMNVAVQVTLPDPGAAASDPAAEPEPAPVPAASPYWHVAGNSGPGFATPNGTPADPAPAPEPDEDEPEQLIGVAPIDATGHTTSDLQARYANVPGVIVVAGSDRGNSIGEVWARYASARCMKAFEGRTFPSLESAMRAIDLWPGRDMLELRDVERCAAHLVDLTQIAGPPADIPPARRGLLRMLGVAR